MLEARVRGFESRTQPKKFLCWKTKGRPKGRPLERFRSFAIFYTSLQTKTPSLVFQQKLQRFGSIPGDFSCFGTLRLPELREIFCTNFPKTFLETCFFAFLGIAVFCKELMFPQS